MRPCRRGVVWLGRPLMGPRSQAGPGAATWPLDGGWHHLLSPLPLSAAARLRPPPSSKCAAVRAGTPLSWSGAPICSGPRPARRSVWRGVGTRFGVAGCQRPQERTRTACAGGKGHAQPWDQGARPVSPFLSQPGSAISGPQRSRRHLLSGPKHHLNLSRWRLHVWGGPSYGEKHSEGLGFKEHDVVPRLPAQKCSLSASTCRLWLLSQAGDGGQEGGCSCPSQGHSQKQYVFPSREIKESGEREPCLEGRQSGCYFSSSLCPEIAQRLSAPPKLRWPEGTLALAPQAGKVLTGRHFLSMRGLRPLCWDGCTTRQPQS